MNDLYLEAKKVKGTSISQVVNDPEWQQVRLSLKGKWKESHKENILTLRNYLAREGWDNPLAIRRVLNVLVGSVHRSGKTDGQPETNELRGEVRRVWREMLQEPYDPSDPKYKDGII